MRDDKLVFEPVYFWGHGDIDAVSSFVSLRVEAFHQYNTCNNKIINATVSVFALLELTSHHFIPVFDSVLSNNAGSVNKNNVLYKRACDIREGDVIMSTSNNMNYYSQEVAALPDSNHTDFHYVIVKQVNTVIKRGLFNRYTPSGNIIVNSIIVSCHSDWIFDPIFDYFKIPHLLPSFYQTLLLLW